MGLDQCQLADHSGLSGDIGHLGDVDQLVQLLDHLLDGGVIPLGDDGHAGDARCLRVSHCKRLDVEVAAAEKGCHPVEHSGLVLHEGYKCVSHQLAPFTSEAPGAGSSRR